MTDPTEQELEQLLDDIFIAHEDNDSFTCNANYTTCTECHQRYYYQSWRPCSHNAKRTIGECNCSLKEEKAEAKAALLSWRDRAVRAGRKNITDICTIDTDDSGNDYVSFFDGSKPAYTVTEFWNRLAALTAEPKEEK